MNTEKELQEAITRELTEWPDATVEFVKGGKHPKAKLGFGGKLLSVSFSGTSGSSRVVHHTLADVRRSLRKLGAVRAKDDPTPDEDEAPYRKPNEGAAKRGPIRVSDPVKPEADVATKLVEAGAATPAQAAAAKNPGELFESTASEGEPGTQRRNPLVRPAAPLVVTTSFLDEDESDEAAEALRAEFEARVSGIIDGIYFDLPADVYHAVPRLSSSGLQRLAVSPATFWKGSWLDPDRPDDDEDETIWRKLGRAYHTARLEPHLFESTYVREPDKSDMPKGTLFTGTEMSRELEDRGLKKSGSIAEQAERLWDSGFPRELLWHYAKADFEAERNGRTVLRGKDYDKIVTDMDRIRGNGDIAPLLTGGEAEVSVFWTDEYGIKMKARLDYLTRDWWDDFKTFDNSKGKNLDQALADSFRYNRYYMQGVVYREAVEAIRVGNLPIIEAANDDQRSLVAHIQIKPAELRCWYIFQEKGGIPNLIAREFPFYAVPLNTLFNEQITTDAARREAVREATRKRTLLHVLGEKDVLQAKKLFVLYNTVYKPGEPWFPITGALGPQPIGVFDDESFHPYWLSGDLR